jgi:HAD superfamily hydrolase (TIGR01509 family)
MIKVAAVLFDLDGVIVASEHLKAAAHAEAAGRFGKPVPREVYAHVMGQTHDAVRAAFLRAAGAEVDPAAYTTVYHTIYHHLVQTELSLTPGMGALLPALRDRGYRLALVTSSSKKSAAITLGRAGLTGFFEVEVFAEDVQRGKPDPQPYQIALERMANCSNEAVAFEDSQAGIASAAFAGLRVFALRHRYNIDQDFTVAFRVLDSLEDTTRIIELIEAADV